MKNFNKLLKLIMATAIAACTFAVMTIPAHATVKHNVKFMYGTKIYQTTVEDGCNVLPPTDTYVPGYNFIGWVGSTTNIKSDITILGAYAPVYVAPAPAPVIYAPSTYEVCFKDGLTGVVFYRQTVSAGANANVPEIPHHEGYHFDHFDGSYTNVYSSRTVTVIYDQDYYDHDWDQDYWDYQNHYYDPGSPYYDYEAYLKENYPGYFAE